MKKLLKSAFCVVLVLSLLTVFSAMVSAKSESDYIAEFSITTDKTTAKKGDVVTVSVNLKTNYPIYAMQIPVIYDGTVFEVQNTSTTNLKSFLSFKDCLSKYYGVNGTWKSPDAMYSRNSNPSYWNSSAVKSQYKIAYASWVADSSISQKLITLNEMQTVVSFELKVKSSFTSAAQSKIFINSDWIKTADTPAGMLAVGRSTTDILDSTTAGHVDVGQMINLSKAEATVGVNMSDIQITYKGNVVTSRINAKTALFSSYKKNPITLGVKADVSGLHYVWSSDDSKIKVDQSGVVTNTFWLFRSAHITVNAYNAEDELLGSDTVQVYFYKVFILK